ncbi:ion channel [uncultured Roseobacter sp.]|uniref:ion channel n=1 Tax=uncultured Roseobacter sp. TaxID=114847 RepID=UPI00260EF8D7|nr:ion channel [uncultured Roseobacter sp.]
MNLFVTAVGALFVFSVASLAFPKDATDTGLLIRYLGILFFLLILALRLFAGAKQRQSLPFALLLFGQVYYILIKGFASLYAKTGIIIHDAQWFEVDRFDYVYFAFITITSLGYGDVAPTPESRPIVVVNVCVGVVINALFVSVLFRAITGRAQGNG